MRRLAVFLALAVGQWLPWIFVGLAGGLVGGPAAAAAGVLVFAGALYWAVRRTAPADRHSWGLSPRQPAGRLLTAGLAAGVLTYLSVFLARWWGGGAPVVEVRGVAVLLVVVTGLLLAGYQALSEEVVFRGAVFTLLPSSVPVRWAVVISTATFVLFHVPRWQELLSGPYALQLLLAGLAFAVAYLRSGSLWLGVGLHGGWNAGAYLLREGDPALLRLTGTLPEGWSGWSSWASVAGNAVLLLFALALTAKGTNADVVPQGSREPAAPGQRLDE